MTSSNMTSSIMVVIFRAEQRDGISINVNCIKTTLMTVNRELEPEISPNRFLTRFSEIGYENRITDFFFTL